MKGNAAERARNGVPNDSDFIGAFFDDVKRLKNYDRTAFERTNGVLLVAREATMLLEQHAVPRDLWSIAFDELRVVFG